MGINETEWSLMIVLKLEFKEREDVTWNVVGDDGRTRRRTEEEDTPKLNIKHAKNIKLLMAQWINRKPIDYSAN